MYTARKIVGRLVFALSVASGALVACAGSAVPAASQASQAAERSPEELLAASKAAHAAKAAGGKVVDVRGAEEFAAGHIDGAIHVPVAEIGARAATGELGAKGDPVVVYCGSGRRAAQAAEALRAAGFTQVVNLGPMSNWENAR